MRSFLLLGGLFVTGAAFMGSRPLRPADTPLHDSIPGAGRTVLVYTTAMGTDLRLTLTDTLRLARFGQPLETQPCVFVDPTKKHQTFVGIGGALTDASAETFAKLPRDKQEEFLTAYYDPKKGIGYTLARTNIHSCDFSSGSYTYIKEGDKELKTFTLDHDRQYRIPFIKRVQQAAGGKIPLFVSPWSPPAFMKDNNNMLQGGKLKKEYFQTWANYFVKFIRGYEQEGIPVWGLTIQNEPMAKQIWESCLFTAEEERDFLKNYLGPTLQRAGLASRKVIVWDHNRDLMYQRATTILNDPAASKYVWGVGFHWYEDWSGGEQVFDNVKRVHEDFGGKNLIFTEGCNGPFNMDSVQNWGLGERYGRSMINDFNNGTVAWTDWNVLLDEQGGPNHVKNFCFSPIHADTRNGSLIYTNAYQYIGHFSKFIRPGATHISSSPSRSPLLSTAFRNRDGKIVVVVMNTSNKELPFHLWIAGNAAPVQSKPRSIMTFIL